MVREWVGQLLGAAYALAVSAVTGKWVFCYTLEYRGYAAVGSEYLFVVVIYWLSFQAAETFLRLLKKKKDRRRKDSVCKIYPKKRELYQKEPDNIIFWYDINQIRKRK